MANGLTKEAVSSDSGDCDQRGNDDVFGHALTKRFLFLGKRFHMASFSGAQSNAARKRTE